MHLRRDEQGLDERLRVCDPSERKGTPRFHPMPGKVAVQLITEDRIGSLIIPVQHRQLRVMGEVVALGDDEPGGDLDFPVSIGDVVMFSTNAGVKVEVNREEVLILRTAEILCKVTWDEEDS